MVVRETADTTAPTMATLAMVTVPTVRLPLVPTPAVERAEPLTREATSTRLTETATKEVTQRVSRLCQKSQEISDSLTSNCNT